MHVVIQGFLSLQPHLLVELVNERFDAPIQLVLTQRGLFPQPPSLVEVERLTHRHATTSGRRLFFIFIFRFRWARVGAVLPRVTLLHVPA